MLVDKATGFVEVARPLEEGGPISEREAVTQANIVRYIRARETYDPPALRDNFELASLLSAGQASKDLAEEFSPSNPANPMKLWGATGRTRVYVESVNFLTNGWMQNPGSPATAAVRFMTTRTTERENIIEHWAANVRFRYTKTPMKNQWRFDNPLGFQVVEYRRDQETVAPPQQQRGRDNEAGLDHWPDRHGHRQSHWPTRKSRRPRGGRTRAFARFPISATMSSPSGARAAFRPSSFSPKTKKSKPWRSAIRSPGRRFQISRSAICLSNRSKRMPRPI